LCSGDIDNAGSIRGGPRMELIDEISVFVDDA